MDDDDNYWYLMTEHAYRRNKMNKLNSSIDIIPITQGTSFDRMMENKRRSELSQQRFKDETLISRVQKYMYENEDKTYIDVSEMAEELQKRYRDYRYKKRGTFRMLVHDAYNQLTEIFSKKSRGCPIFDDEDENEVDVESDSLSPLANEMSLRRCKKPLRKQNGNSSDKELIDISSSSEDEDDAAKVEFSAGDNYPLKVDHPMDDSKEKNIKEYEISKNALQEEGAVIKTDNDKEAVRGSQNKSPSLAPIPYKGRSIPEEYRQHANETQISMVLNESRKRTRKRNANSSNFVTGKRAKIILLTKPGKVFADVGGYDKILKRVCRLFSHVKHPEIFRKLGVLVSRGFLVNGPPGCGKTLLVHAIAGELEMPLVKVVGQEFIDGDTNDYEQCIKNLFDQAKSLAPCILFFDEIDKITTDAEAGRKIIAQLLSLFDEMNSTENDRVIVVATTSYPDLLDPDLKKTGCFDREISLGIPDRDARAKILALHTKNVILAPDVSLSTIASLTPGFVGADLVNLIQEAATAAINRVFEENLSAKADKNIQNFRNDQNINENTGLEPSTSAQMAVPVLDKPSNEADSELKMDVIRESSKFLDLTEWITWLHNKPPLSPESMSSLCIRHCDFEVALRIVQPAAHREGFITVPDVTWDDIGSLSDIKDELRTIILSTVRHSERFSALDLTPPTGIMLCGPPGCGKTLLAKAVSNEAGINFISVKGPELLNRYDDDCGKIIHQCFLRAKNSAPCILFFDELDILCPKKVEGDNSMTPQVLNQMLTEMDEVKGFGVILMAASNRPDIIDPMIYKPGRLDKILYVGLPTAADRIDILRTLTKNGTKPKLADDVSFEAVGCDSKCEGFTGSDLAALIRESKYEAAKELMAGFTNDIQICIRHFAFAFDKVIPSVREKDIEYYERLRKMYSTKKSYDKSSMEMPLDPPISDTGVEPMET